MKQHSIRSKHAFLLVFSCALLLLSSHCNALSVTTFNMLAPVHRSMDSSNKRESEREDWWRPRAEFLAKYVSTQLHNSDIILLQEWWCSTKFEDVFDYHVSPIFERVAEQRPGRQDGMAVLIKRGGKLQLIDSQPLETAPQRIAQLVTCRHHDDEQDVAIANIHLSFPSHPDPLVNERRQACELSRVVRAMSKQCQYDSHRLEILGGDFNSESAALPSKLAETKHLFTNCASAAAEQALSDKGGQVNLGITHKQHDGLLVSVDHVFARVAPVCHKQSSNVLRKYGYLDAAGTRIVDCVRGDLELESGIVVSDHRPVTATLEWPPSSRSKQQRPLDLVRGNDLCNMPLDPLEPPSYMGGGGGNNVTATLIRGRP